MADDRAESLLNKAFEKGADEDVRNSTYEQMWGYSEQARRDEERQWQINMSFYMGHQNIGWSSILHGVTELKAPSHRVMLVDNRLMPKVRAKISRQMGKPGAQVIPSSTSEIDLKRAELKERILEHHDRENKLPLKQYSLSLWGAVCGTAYTDVDWRDAGGAIYRDGMEEYIEGEIRTKIRGPWEVWQAPDAKIDTFGSWCWIGQLYDVDVAQDEFGVKDITADASKYRDPFLEGTLFGQFTRSAGSLQDIDDNPQRRRDQVLVRRLWIFPTNKHPEGKEVLYINDKAHKESAFTWFTLTKYINLPKFDQGHGDTEFRQCIPLQKQRNRTRSSIAEYLKTMVKGKWIAHKSAKLGASAINSEHAEVIQYEGSAPPPTQMNLPSLPTDVWQELVINDQSMDDIFADRPSSQGKRETGVNSGKMTHLLQEEDDRQHTPGVSLYEQCWTGTYEKVLDLASQKYTTGKQVMVAGKDMDWDIRIIDRGQDEHGNETGEDLLGGRNRVQITLGSSLPSNKTLRRQVIVENYQLGLYGDPMNPEVKRKVLKQIDAGVVDDIFDDQKLDETSATEENQTMMMNPDGKIPTGPIDNSLVEAAMIAPAPFENHPVHMKIHNKARKSLDFKRLDETLQEVFNAHCSMHEQMMMEQQQALIAMQAQAEGGNKQPATPVPPSEQAAAEGTGP